MVRITSRAGKAFVMDHACVAACVDTENFLARGKRWARKDVVTLAVADLERALVFYRDGLGLESPGVTGTQFVGNETHPAGAVVMFTLDNGTTLGLYPRGELAKDAEIPPGPAQSGEFSLGHLVADRTDVDALLARAEAAGATVTEAHDRPWGIYSSYFRDPDGHLWEIIYNPHLLVVVSGPACISVTVTRFRKPAFCTAFLKN